MSNSFFFLSPFSMCPVTSEKCRPTVELLNGPVQDMSSIQEPK